MGGLGLQNPELKILFQSDMLSEMGQNGTPCKITFGQNSGQNGTVGPINKGCFHNEYRNF